MFLPHAGASMRPPTSVWRWRAWWWFTGPPGGKPAAVQRFSTWGATAPTLTLLSVTVLGLGLGTKLLSNSSYAKKERKKEREREREEALACWRAFLCSCHSNPTSFLSFCLPRAHFPSTAFWNVLQMNYCKEMHINIHIYIYTSIYMNIVYSTQSYLLFPYIYEL